MPGTRFMGVHGGYGTQIIENPQTRNIQFMSVQVDMKNIYDRTRIIIMPSVYESWGMVAAEAMASGIPVICSDTPGLRENCGDAAIYVSGQDVQGYRNAIEELADDDVYNDAVRRGLKRNKRSDLNKLLQFMETPKRAVEAGHALTEKQVFEPVKEKREIPPEKEKKVIDKPGVPKRSHKKKLANG
jgi:glycosyltransferase involved in cell wall biosynthesis